MAHLKGIGFTSSNDIAVLGLLKDLGFLSAEGSPTPRYHAFRDRSQSRRILGEAVREAYGDLFLINEDLKETDKVAVEGKFKQTHNVTDRVATDLTRTFFALLKLADVGPAKRAAAEDDAANGGAPAPSSAPLSAPAPTNERAPGEHERPPFVQLGGLRYNIEIHLPATKDIEVFNAIFKSLKEHLIAH